MNALNTKFSSGDTIPQMTPNQYRTDIGMGSDREWQAYKGKLQSQRQRLERIKEWGEVIASVERGLRHAKRHDTIAHLNEVLAHAKQKQGVLLARANPREVTP